MKHELFINQRMGRGGARCCTLRPSSPPESRSPRSLRAARGCGRAVRAADAAMRAPAQSGAAGSGRLILSWPT